MEKNKAISPLNFSLLSILTGIVAGLGAVFFRGLIAFFHNAFFLGTFSLTYNSNAHTPAGPWGLFVILVPVAGAVGVAFLVKNFAPEARGHGVPEVIDGIYYARGIIRPIVALIKAVASALSIGTGASIGREGPIIQIGASFGSTMGQIVRMPARQRITLVAAGAGAGIAATFNTPIGGVLFAIEIMMLEVSARTLAPVAIATVTGTYIGQLFFGNYPSFIIPGFEHGGSHITRPWVLFSYVGMGLLMGLVSTVYIKSIYLFEDIFDKYVRGNYYVRHMCGMLMVGIMMYLMMRYTGNYYIEGIGYATVQDILTGTLTPFFLLLLLFVLKLLSTSFSLGSGASGGIFSPAMFMGATLGAAYGTILNALFPDIGISPPAFAVAGMAGVVGGSTGAAMAAIVMIFEMTLDYTVIIPMTITVAISHGMRRLLSSESIYSLKLSHRGHYMPDSLHADYHHVRRAKEIMDKNIYVLPASTKLSEFEQAVSEKPTASHFLVALDDNRIAGFVQRDALTGVSKEFESEGTLGDIVRNDYITVSQDTKLVNLIIGMNAGKVSFAIVTARGADPSTGNVLGLISKELIMYVLAEAVELFAD